MIHKLWLAPSLVEALNPSLAVVASAKKIVGSSSSFLMATLFVKGDLGDSKKGDHVTKVLPYCNHCALLVVGRVGLGTCNKRRSKMKVEDFMFFAAVWDNEIQWAKLLLYCLWIWFYELIYAVLSSHCQGWVKGVAAQAREVMLGFTTAWELSNLVLFVLCCRTTARATVFDDIDASELSLG